ncbi:hypothetical protein GQ53DRAFT_882314, partial [Thozetella sp. PMI_491]
MLQSLMLPTLCLFAGLALPASGNDCTQVPSWTVKKFRSNSTDAVSGGGNASFTVINNLSGASDDLTCKLQVNYRCLFAGTPSDQNLTVFFEIRTGYMIFSLDKTLSCPGNTSSIHAIGKGELPLNCTSEVDIGETISCSLEEDTIEGAFVELAPETP